MHLPPYGMYLLTFDEFHWAYATNRHQSIVSFQFFGLLSQIAAGGSTFLVEDDDRSTC